MKRLISSFIGISVLLLGCKKETESGVNTTPETISWEQAIRILKAGDVMAVSQRHNLTVTLDMNDGTTLTTLEPHIDAIIQEVEKCGLACAKTLIATE